MMFRYGGGRLGAVEEETLVVGQYTSIVDEEIDYAKHILLGGV